MLHHLPALLARCFLALLITLVTLPAQMPAAAASYQTGVAPETHVNGERELPALAAALDSAEESKIGLMPSSETAVAIATSGSHTCALTTGGGVMCWGDNFYGQLGDGTTTQRPTPVPVSGLSSGVMAIAAGGAHTCALKSGGEVLCWGFNQYGQLGDGTTTTTPPNGKLTPVPVIGLPSGVTAITAGYLHTCALTASGGTMCWGSNEYGQLGDGTTTNSPTPVQVTGLPSGVTAIAAGGSHTCGLTASGGVTCWGKNDFGQLGDGTTTSSPTPVPVSGLPGSATAIAAGYAHTCALITGGGATCWGWNFYGQLGDGTTTDGSAPVAVSGLGSSVTAISAVYHTCALTAGGGVMCWGYNEDGGLGDGTTTSSPTPVAVIGLSSGVTAIAAGNSHTCALTTVGWVKCWGDNSYGELGNGTTTDSYTPVGVFGLSLARVYLPLLQQ